MSTAYTHCLTQNIIVSVSKTCNTCENCLELQQWHKRKYIPKPIRREVLKRDNYTCLKCYRKPPNIILSVDHIVSASLGGLPILDNLQTLCTSCNMAKNANEDLPNYRSNRQSKPTHNFTKKE